MKPRAYLRQFIPSRYIQAYRIGRRVAHGQPVWPPPDLYEQLYEYHSLHSSDSDAVGRGSFDVIGASELAVLQREGLQPEHTLVDFGCGTGRLAIHAIPALPRGHYIGIDISKEMLRRLGDRLTSQTAGQTCRVSLLHQPTEVFPLEDSTVDVLCAFSVFTHMEHEDSFRYMRDARRVVRPGGRLVFSCLSMDSALGRQVFREVSSIDLQSRWGNVRSITTSRDLMLEIARLAGWTLVGWYPGDEPNVVVPGHDSPLAFGQSIGVLE